MLDYKVCQQRVEFKKDNTKEYSQHMIVDQVKNKTKQIFAYITEQSAYSYMDYKWPYP